MNTDQNADFKMMVEVQTVCNTYLSDWNGTPSFKTPFTKLVSTVINILPQALAQQGQTSTGVTVDKATSRNTLEGLILPMAGGIEAYAASVSNTSLRRNAHLTPSDLHNESDMAVTGQAERIATLATDNIANLGPFGITAAKVTALRTAASTFSGWIGKPKETIGQKKGGTDWIEELRQSGRALLDTMDAQMVLFQTSASDFYQQYFFARRITDPARRKRAVVFSVRDTAGRPVQDVVIDMGVPMKEKRTGPSGTCFVAQLAPGMYEAKVMKNGYQMQGIPFPVNDGETTRVDVVLVKTN